MTGALFDDGTRGATISADRQYRYNLWRRRAPGPVLGWIMLNPSTADANVDDPTVRQCSFFAEREGYAGIRIVNLFAFRTPKPTVLWKAHKNGTDIVGPDNDEWVTDLLEDREGVGAVVAAWGAAEARASRRVAFVVGLAAAAGRELLRLTWPAGNTSTVQARHPLLVNHDQPFAPYVRPEGPCS